MKAIITLPNYDDATSYLYHYSKKIVKEAESIGIKIIQFSRPRLRRRNVEKSIKKLNPSLVLFNAHGNDFAIYGDRINNEEEAIIIEKENHYLLEGRITYARACWAALSLGKACTKNGGCFIGYKTPFSFWINQNKSATPLRDENAKLFLEPSNQIALSLLKKKTAHEAVQRFNRLSKKNMLKLLQKKKEPGALAAAMVLWNNMEGQEILGDKELKAF